MIILYLCFYDEDFKDFFMIMIFYDYEKGN